MNTWSIVYIAAACILVIANALVVRRFSRYEKNPKREKESQSL